MLDHEVERERRLIGDNDGDETSGRGALPLPEVFTTVLQHLHDKGPASFTALTRVVRGKVAYKEKRILAVYPSWDDFVTDVLAQLLHKGLAVLTPDVQWQLGEMSTGVSYQAVGGIFVVIYGELEREERNQVARLALDTASLQAQFRNADMLSEKREQGFALILDGLQQARPPRREAERRPKILARGAAAAFYRDYAKAHGWHRLINVADAWHEVHPEAMPSKSVLQNAAKSMHEEGLLDRREYGDITYRSRHGRGTRISGYEYRWRGNEDKPDVLPQTGPYLQDRPVFRERQRRQDRNGRIIYPAGTPQRHPDEPDREFWCEDCGQWKPLTDKNWQQTPSHREGDRASSGHWYWSLKFCRLCKARQ